MFLSLYKSNLLLLLVSVPPLTWEVLEDDAWLEDSLLVSTILTVILHSSLWALPQPFQQQPPSICNTAPWILAEFFVSLQCWETQIWVPVNLRAASLSGKLLTKQTGEKLTLLHLFSYIQVSGLEDKSTKFYVHLFIRAQEIDYCPVPCFHLQWKVKINLEVICILIISSSEEKTNISA